MKINFGKFKRKIITIHNCFIFQDYDEVADGLPNSDDEGQEQICISDENSLHFVFLQYFLFKRKHACLHFLQIAHFFPSMLVLLFMKN